MDARERASLTIRYCSAVTSLLTIAERELMDALRSASHRVSLASPFLSIRVAKQLADIANASTARRSLLTRLDAAAAAGGYLSTDGLRTLINAGVTIRHAPRLHAKVYLTDDRFGIVGSANLTGPGLGGFADPNLEMSVRSRRRRSAVAPRSRQRARTSFPSGGNSHPTGPMPPNYRHPPSTLEAFWGLSAGIRIQCAIPVNSRRRSNRIRGRCCVVTLVTPSQAGPT